MIKKLVHTVTSCLLITSCGVYSFTGASIPAQAKSVTVNYFTTSITNSPASLKHKMTEGLKDLFLSQTSLNLEDKEGDLIFTGKIIKYQINPIAIKANETAGKNRLTIDIEIEYINKFNNEENFKSNFSRYRDFNSSENLSDLEDALIEEISVELLEDVYNKAFVNW